MTNVLSTGSDKQPRRLLPPTPTSSKPCLAQGMPHRTHAAGRMGSPFYRQPHDGSNGVRPNTSRSIGSKYSIGFERYAGSNDL